MTGIIGNRVSEADSFPLTVQSRGLGIFTRADGIAVGWLDETRIYLSNADEKCQTVIVTNRADEIRNLISALEKADSSLSNICILKQETNR